MHTPNITRPLRTIVTTNDESFTLNCDHAMAIYMYDVFQTFACLGACAVHIPTVSMED